VSSGILWIVLAASGLVAALAAFRLWQSTRRRPDAYVGDEHSNADSQAVAAAPVMTGEIVIVERIIEPPPEDPTGTETVEVDLREADEVEASVPSTDPATVEADELILTDPVDVHHHHH
jgi:hypothetical protein